MSPERIQNDPRLTVFFLGCATVVAQAVLVRESMAAMGGSETAWGVVMALWLAGMAVGARFGVRFGCKRLAPWLPTLVVGLAGLGVIALRSTPSALGAASGETITTGSAIWLWALAIVPAAIAGGLAFPSLAHSLGSTGGGRAYGFEAVGALIGGILLSIGLVYLGAAGATCCFLGAVAAGAAWQRRSWAAAAVALAALALVSPSGDALARAEWSWSGRPGALRSWLETRSQKIAVSDGPPTSIYGDGRFLASYPDPWAVEPRAHLVMLLHPDPHQVFALGCVVNGAVEAMAEHPVDLLTVVEEDPDLLRALPTWYGSAMKATLGNPRVRAVAADPLRALMARDDWDLIVLLDGDPLTLRSNRTRTLEFLRQCRAHMRSDGVLVLRVGVPDTYIGGAGGRMLSIMADTVRTVFERLELIPGSDTLLVAGGPEAEITLEPAALADRLEGRALGGSGLQAEMIPILVDPDRAHELSARLGSGSRPNTTRNPRAVLAANQYHEARVLPGLTTVAGAAKRAFSRPLTAVFGSLVVILLLVAVRKHAPVITAATVGFCSMGWWLVLISIWQSTRGSVYSEIGALTAAFMAGVATGALVASRWPNPERRLWFVLLGGSVLSAAIAAGVAFVAPAATIPLFLAAGGLLTGAAFPGLTRLVSRDTLSASGTAFAADEAGAALAALVVGIVLIPWLGMTVTALGITILQVAAIPVVLLQLRRQ